VPIFARSPRQVVANDSGVLENGDLRPFYQNFLRLPWLEMASIDSPSLATLQVQWSGDLYSQKVAIYLPLLTNIVKSVNQTMQSSPGLFVTLWLTLITIGHFILLLLGQISHYTEHVLS